MTYGQCYLDKGDVSDTISLDAHTDTQCWNVAPRGHTAVKCVGEYMYVYVCGGMWVDTLQIYIQHNGKMQTTSGHSR